MKLRQFSRFDNTFYLNVDTSNGIEIMASGQDGVITEIQVAELFEEGDEDFPFSYRKFICRFIDGEWLHGRELFDESWLPQLEAIARAIPSVESIVWEGK